MQCVSKIASQLSEDCFEKVRETKKTKKKLKKPFGQNIKYVFQERRSPCPDTKFLVDLSAVTGGEIIKDFSMNYDNVAAMISSKEDPKKNQNSIKKNGVSYSPCSYLKPCICQELRGKGKYQSMDNTKIGKERVNSFQKK